MTVVSIILAIALIGVCMKLHNTLTVGLEASYYRGWTDCESSAINYAMKYGYHPIKVQQELFSASKVEMWESRERTK